MRYPEFARRRKEGLEELRCFFCGKLFRTIERLSEHEEACGESFFEDGVEDNPETES